MPHNGYWEHNPDIYIKKALLMFMMRSVPHINLDVVAFKRNEIVDNTLISFGMTNGQYFGGLVEDVNRCFDDLMLELRGHPKCASKTLTPKF